MWLYFEDTEHISMAFIQLQASHFSLLQVFRIRVILIRIRILLFSSMAS